MATPIKHTTPNLFLLRKVLFWDTDIDTIDWYKMQKAVIQRIFERGNDVEKQEIIRFYGMQRVEEALLTNSRKPYKIYAALQHGK